MVKRYLTLEHEFVCMTEDATGLNPDIQILKLPNNNLQGWWYKPTVFSPTLGLDGVVLFIDLDVIIFNDLDKFFTHAPNKFCISRDFNPKNKSGMNSSCFRFNTNTLNSEYESFMLGHRSIIGRLHGDQDWMQETIKDYEFWPEVWLKSYKWEMINKTDLTKIGNRFIVNKDPSFDSETSIAVFHGEPNPHQIKNTWCETNWR
jgi:hypothetical protein